MNLVLTTSTGEARTVVQKPAPKADRKWQGILSLSSPVDRIFILIRSYETSSAALTIALRATFGRVPGTFNNVGIIILFTFTNAHPYNVWPGVRCAFLNISSYNMQITLQKELKFIISRVTRTVKLLFRSRTLIGYANLSRGRGFLHVRQCACMPAGSHHTVWQCQPGPAFLPWPHQWAVHLALPCPLLWCLLVSAALHLTHLCHLQHVQTMK